VRRLICGEMEWFGIRLDERANESLLDEDRAISAPDSRVELVVIHSDEEAIIARETERVIRARTGA
jgi:acetate kinase